jgi:hypothetical protein
MRRVRETIIWRKIMKSWTTRLGLLLTMLAMVLVISIPAVADEDDFEEFLAAELTGDVEVDDVDCDVDSDGWSDFEDDDDDNDGWSDFEDDDDDNDGWNDDEDVECVVELDVAGEEVEVLIDDLDGDGWSDFEDDDDDNDGWSDFEDDDDDNDGWNDDEDDE